MADLITSAYAQQAIEAGGNTLTGAQSTHLASAISAVSQAIKRWLGGREIPQANHADIQEVLWDGSIYLDQIPVNRIDRIRANLSDALKIEYDGAATRATVTFSSTGDFVTGQTITGLTLTSTTSGVDSSTSIVFATDPTISDVADAINAVSGWAATVRSGYETWPSADLVWRDFAVLNAIDGGWLSVWADDISNATIDRSTGRLDLRWTDWGSGPVEVTYNAGFATVPADIQEVAASAVWLALSSLSRDGSIESERLGEYSYKVAAGEALEMIKPEHKAILATYRIHRA